MSWTQKQVLALAPDSNSSKAASKLSTLAKWSQLGANEQALWGACKGSGKKPYQTSIDLAEPAFKCSCPSRKFPCKHALALFLLWVQEQGAFGVQETPEWVREWLGSRKQRAEKHAEQKKTKTAKTKDPEAAQKRAERRIANIKAGLEELELWLHDAMRQGLATMIKQPRRYWENMAARLVDAQAPGLANRVRALAWENDLEKLMEALGQLHLLLEGFKRLEQLPEDVQAEVQTLIGLSQEQEALLSQKGLKDHWQVRGQSLQEENNLKTQRTWLYSPQHQCYALILDFAYGTASFKSNLLVNTNVEAEVVFFAGLAPRRGLIKDRWSSTPLKAFTGLDSLQTAQISFVEHLRCNPWLQRLPLSLEAVTVMKDGDAFFIRDHNHHIMPSVTNWQLMALSGGHPVSLFGEWDGHLFHPMNISLGDRCLRIN